MLITDKRDGFLIFAGMNNFVAAEDILRRCDAAAKERIFSFELEDNHCTPFQHAVATQQFDLIALLLRNGDCINRVNSIGLTALNVAVGSSRYNPKLVNQLLQAGASTTNKNYKRTFQLITERGTPGNLVQFIHQLNEFLISQIKFGKVLPSTKLENLSRFSLIELCLLTKNEELLKALLEKIDGDFDYTFQLKIEEAEENYYSNLSKLKVFLDAQLEDVVGELDLDRCSRFLFESNLLIDDDPNDNDKIVSTLGGVAHLVNFERGFSLLLQHRIEQANRNFEKGSHNQFEQYKEILTDILIFGTVEQLGRALSAILEMDVNKIVDQEVVFKLLGDKRSFDKIAFLIMAGLNPNLKSEKSTFSMAGIAAIFNNVNFLDFLIKSKFLFGGGEELSLVEGYNLEEKFLASAFVGETDIGDVLRGEFDVQRARVVLNNLGHEINYSACTITVSLLQLAFIFQADNVVAYLLERAPFYRSEIGLLPKKAF